MEQYYICEVLLTILEKKLRPYLFFVYFLKELFQ